MTQSFDAAWHRQAMDGSAEAIRALADGMLTPLWRFCLYRVGNDRHLCDEVVQETLLQAIDRLEDYEPARAGGNIFAWLCGLARNEIRRSLAARRNTSSLEIAWERIDRNLRETYARLESQPLESDVLQNEQTRQVVNATLATLPAHYREVLEAKYVKGQSVRDMAVAARVTEKAVESQLSRAREAFRATFLTLARE